MSDKEKLIQIILQMSELEASNLLRTLADHDRHESDQTRPLDEFLTGLETTPTHPAQGQIEQLIQQATDYLYGLNGVRIDKGKALDLLERAADLGSSEAHLQAADMYFEGEGTRKDRQAALEHMKQAAALGEVQAYSAMAYFFGQTDDPDRAIACWERYLDRATLSGPKRTTRESLAISISAYLTTCLRENRSPSHLDLIRDLKADVLSHIDKMDADSQARGIDAFARFHEPIRKFLASTS